MIKWIESQAFASYELWECHNAGFWVGTGCKHNNVEMSAYVLETSLFMQSMQTLALIWPVSCAVHLTNSASNHRAWLGQAACFIEVGNCISCTVSAWMKMPEQNRIAANHIANHFTVTWKLANSKNATYQQRSTQLELAF
jgi:hypothetical protein